MWLFFEKNKSTCDWHVLCCAVLRLLVLQRPGLLRAHTPNITTLHRTLPSQPQHPIVAAPVHAAVTWACCVHSCWRRWKHPTKLNARPLQRWVAGHTAQPVPYKANCKGDLTAGQCSTDSTVQRSTTRCIAGGGDRATSHMGYPAQCSWGNCHPGRQHPN